MDPLEQQHESRWKKLPTEPRLGQAVTYLRQKPAISPGEDLRSQVVNKVSILIEYLTRCKAKPVGSPPAYLPRCLLFIANWSLNWFACVHRVR